MLLSLEARISRLSVKNNFWHRVCSCVWLPMAFRSGIRINKASKDGRTFSAILPFTRFNKNWYNAMAGAALLGNSEIAGGWYVFRECGENYTVMCRNLDYRFLRPCYGPALYHIEPREDIQEKLQTGNEFNITLDLTIVQMVQGKNEKERRVGKCAIAFHVTPKAQARQQRLKRRRRQ